MFHVKHGKDGYMTLKKLFEMCTNCNARKFFKVMICGYVEVILTLEKYGDYEVYNFGVHGRIIEVVLMEKG